MKCPAGVKGREAALNQFFLRLLGLWEGIIDIPPPPQPPFDVETMEPIEPPPGFYWPEDDDPDAFQLDPPRPPLTPARRPVAAP